MLNRLVVMQSPLKKTAYQDGGSRFKCSEPRHRPRFEKRKASAWMLSVLHSHRFYYFPMLQFRRRAVKFKIEISYYLNNQTEEYSSSTFPNPISGHLPEA